MCIFSEKHSQAVDKYVYLGKTITQMGDIKMRKRILLGWNAFGKWSHILKKRKTGPEVKKRLMDMHTLSVITYHMKLGLFLRNSIRIFSYSWRLISAANWLFS